MKKIILIIMSFCIVLSISGCYGKKSVLDNEAKKADKDILNVNIPNSIRESMSIAISRDKIEKKYGKADITRNLETNKYEIRNRDDGSKLIVVYNNVTDTVAGIWQLKKLLNRDAFKTITAGKSISNDVLLIDPYTTIMPSKETALSEHKLINNEVALINYTKNNNEWTVEKITIIPDPSKFMALLLPEDAIAK